MEGPQGFQRSLPLQRFSKPPLSKTKFDLSKTIKEWKSLKKYVQYNAYGIEARKLWQNMRCYRADEYPQPVHSGADNDCDISSVHSSVETAFKHSKDATVRSKTTNVTQCYGDATLDCYQ